MSVEITDLRNKWIDSVFKSTEIEAYIEYLAQPLVVDFVRANKCIVEKEDKHVEFVVEYIEDGNVNVPMPIKVEIRIPSSLNRHPYYVFKLGNSPEYKVTEVPHDMYVRLVRMRSVYQDWMRVNEMYKEAERENDTQRTMWTAEQARMRDYINPVRY